MFVFFFRVHMLPYGTLVNLIGNMFMDESWIFFGTSSKILNHRTQLDDNTFLPLIYVLMYFTDVRFESSRVGSFLLETYLNMCLVFFLRNIV